MSDSPGAGGDEPRAAATGADDAAVQGGDGTETPTQQKPGLIGFSAKSPIKKALDERKGPKNNKRKWGDASFVHAARALELRQGHQGTPVYSEDMLASESASRQPLRLLSKCKFTVHADIVKAHPALKQLPAQGLTLAVYQVWPTGPAAWLPPEVIMARLEPMSVLTTKAVVPAIRPMMCVVADGESGAKNTAGFDVLEKFLAAEDQMGLLVLRTIETPACQISQTSTFKQEHEEVISMFSNASNAGREYFVHDDDEPIIVKKHLRAAFVDTNPSGKGADAMSL